MEKTENNGIVVCQNCGASTPEQSLAEYRNKVIEDCAVKADALANCEENTDGYRNGAAWCAEAIRAMKEQP